MLVLIFLLCSHPTPDMTLGFVQIQDYSCLGGESRIDGDQSLRAVLVYCALTDPKAFCCLPDSSVVIYDVIGNGDCALIDLFLHGFTPENVFYNLCRRDGAYVQKRKSML